MTVDEMPVRRSERINLRVDPDVDALLRQAAAVEHKSLSAFLLDAGVEKARATLEERRRIALGEAEFARVLDELDRPARVVTPLLRLAERVAKDAGP